MGKSKVCVIVCQKCGKMLILTDKVETYNFKCKCGFEETYEIKTTK